MKKLVGVEVILFLVVLLVIILVIMKKNTSQSVQAPLNTPVATQKTIGWIPFWDEETAKESFFSHSNLINYISVFWYKLTLDGKISLYNSAQEDESIIRFAHEHHVKVFALIANMADNGEGGDWDAARVEHVISSENTRKQHISDLVDLVEKKGFDGVDIDYENLPAQDKENFSVFIEELSHALHAQQKLVGVAIHPKTSENNPDEDNGSHAQDLVRLSKAADQLYFMTYLEHGLFSDPGPPGSYDWIRQVISYALSIGVPNKKIFMGVGLMGVAWREDPNGTIEGDSSELTFSYIHALVSNMGLTPSWDDASKTPYLIFSDQNGKHIVWFENSTSVTQRFNLAHQMGVGGIALWRLGGEDPGIWYSLEQTL